LSIVNIIILSILLVFDFFTIVQILIFTYCCPSKELREQAMMFFVTCVEFCGALISIDDDKNKRNPKNPWSGLIFIGKIKQNVFLKFL
jgi:hypothetical protein